MSTLEFTYDIVNLLQIAKIIYVYSRILSKTRTLRKWNKINQWTHKNNSIRTMQYSFSSQAASILQQCLRSAIKSAVPNDNIHESLGRLQTNYKSRSIFISHQNRYTHLPHSNCIHSKLGGRSEYTARSFFGTTSIVCVWHEAQDTAKRDSGPPSQAILSEVSANWAIGVCIHPLPGLLNDPRAPHPACPLAARSSEYLQAASPPRSSAIPTNFFALSHLLSLACSQCVWVWVYSFATLAKLPAPSFHRHLLSLQSWMNLLCPL